MTDREGETKRASHEAILRRRIGWRVLTVQPRSILEIGPPVDGIVSPDDGYLTHSGGVSEAIWRAAGEEELNFALDGLSRPRSLGSVVVTPAFGLGAQDLLHAITLDLDRDQHLEPLTAAELYGRVLDESGRRGLRRIAVPLLGAGYGGLGAEGSAVALARALDERAATPSSVVEVVLAVIGEDGASARNVLEARLVERAPIDVLVHLLLESKLEPAALESLRSVWSGRAEDGSEQEQLLSFGDDLVNVVGLLVEASRELLASHDKSQAVDPSRTSTEAASALRAIMGHLSAAVAELRRVIDASHPSDDDQRAALRAVLRALEAVALVVLGPHEARSAAHAGGGTPEGTTPLPELLRQLTEASRRPGKQANSPPRQRNAPPGRGTAGPGRGLDIAVAPLTPATGTEHVRRLVAFLERHLGQDERTALFESLERRGYRGSPELQLVECVVSVDDPSELLTEHFTSARLRSLLRAELGVEAPTGASHKELAFTTLQHLGFPSISPPTGLHTAHEALRKLAESSPQIPDAELRSAATEAASKIEGLVHLLLRFYCRTIFDVAPEVHFRERLGEPRSSIARLSLGKLFELMHALQKDLAKVHHPRLLAMKIDFKSRRLIPPEADAIPTLRNQFAHHREDDAASMRRDAEKLIATALRLVEHWAAEPRIYPYVVRIEELRFDRWARRIVHAATDAGVRERIFTDRALEPGRIYCMHPLTNPMRVDPLLLEMNESAAGSGSGQG